MVELNVQYRSEETSVVREAKLRAEYADLYPPLDPEVWLPATEVSAKILFWRISRDGLDAAVRRPLDERHFEFRGGWRRGGTAPLRTRTNDSDVPQH